MHSPHQRLQPFRRGLPYLLRMNRSRAHLVSKAFLAIAAFLLIVPFARAEETPLRVAEITIGAGGGDVRATVFEPARAARRPVILVLHGAGGMIFDGPEMRRLSRHLAGEGNAVYLLHYFNSTGTPFALRGSTMERHFETWRRTVMDAIQEIQALERDRSPVGIYGYSLGAFLALFAASDNPRVGAVVEHAGGVWNDKFDRLGRLPAVLMIHGERDTRVPFRQYAQAAVKPLRKRSSRVETRFFPAEDHGFSAAAMRSVREDAAAFFAKWLRE
ncbi:MAG TPA: dienelactone hydrolase family protein [Chthoniobacterales bacterium]|nr:dienelactone hydrolase family protein [Chthoniobacterales bacterium]